MNIEYKKYLPVAVTVIAIVFAILHLVMPSLGIDYIFISFLLLAALPWVLPLLKSFELPGGLKIELKETKAATDKISTTLNIQNSHHNQTASSIKLTDTPKDNFSLLEEIAASDPNLAFVGFRIEVEKRIRTLAVKNTIPAERVSLMRLVSELKSKGVLTSPIVAGLLDLITLGNKAAHGADVEPTAATWLLAVGPKIIETLDNLIEESGV